MNMPESPSVSNFVLDHMIIRKEIRSDALNRIRSRERLEPMRLRTRTLNGFIEANASSPSLEFILKSELSQDDFPSHIALVPDGNRRFAWAREENVGFGYHKGSQKLENFRNWAMIDNTVDFISVFTLSTENIERRPEEELGQLFDVFTNFFNRVAEDEKVMENRIKHEVRGNQEGMKKLPNRVLDAIDNMEESTSDFNEEGDKQVTILMPYGSRDDIVNAARVTSQSNNGDLLVTDEGEENTDFRKNLIIGDLPDVDLMIRTSEKRLSNFLLYENAYSELVFINRTWPSFSESDFYESIYKYSNRERRFGV